MGGGEHLSHHLKSVLPTALTTTLFFLKLFFSFKTFCLVTLPIAAEFLSINYIILQIFTDFDHIMLPVFNHMYFVTFLDTLLQLLHIFCHLFFQIFSPLFIIYFKPWILKYLWLCFFWYSCSLHLKLTSWHSHNISYGKIILEPTKYHCGTSYLQTSISNYTNHLKTRKPRLWTSIDVESEI